MEAKQSEWCIYPQEAQSLLDCCFNLKPRGINGMIAILRADFLQPSGEKQFCTLTFAKDDHNILPPTAALKVACEGVSFKVLYLWHWSVRKHIVVVVVVVVIVVVVVADDDYEWPRCFRVRHAGTYDSDLTITINLHCICHGNSRPLDPNSYLSHFCLKCFPSD